MSKLKISILVKMCPETRTIGNENGEFPWGNIQTIYDQIDDITMGGSQRVGCPLIVGRETFEKNQDNLLPKRPYIVFSRNKNYKLDRDYSDGDHGPKVVVVNCIKKALAEAERYESYSDRKQNEVIVIGGAEIFKLFLQHANKLILFFITYKNGNKMESGVKFPNYTNSGFKIKSPGLEIEDPYYKIVLKTLERD